MIRRAALRIAVREMSWRLLEEFGDHYALAEELEIMCRLAWWGSDAFRAAGIADAAHSSNAQTRHVRPPHS